MENVLSYLMEMLDVSGKELAVQIGVDTAIISKWKNGKRKIPKNSDYGKSIAEYFFQEDFLAFRQKILHIMKDAVPDIEELQEEKQKKILAEMLENNVPAPLNSDRRREENQYVTAMQVFDGKGEGWYRALDTFFQEIQKVNPQENIIMADFGEVDWENVDNVYFDKIYQRVKEISQNGRKLIIMDLLKDSYRSYQAIFRWLPMYMLPEVEVYYVHEWDVEQKQCFILSGGEQMALLGKRTEGEKEERVYNLYRDYHNTMFLKRQVEAFLSKAKRMIYLNPIGDTLYTLKLMDANIHTGIVTYMLNPMPTFLNMPPELVEEILYENGIVGEDAERISEVNKTRSALRAKCHYCQIYDIDKIEWCLEQKEFVSPLLSKILGRDIIVKREQFRKQLLYILKQMERENYMVLLPSFQSDLADIPDSISFTVQEDALVMCWDDKKFDYTIYSTETTLVGGFSNYMKEVLANIPAVKKKKTWSENRIKSIVNNLSIF
ncbi:MAG: hypothetical protein ACI4EF_09775 [Coprococcus sp.]